MKNIIYVPDKIKIGYQKRDDTYTKKLAYVIYYDQKNKLRKETSWQNWRNKEIDPEDFDNIPTSGFVLNKKVGGYMSHYNMRQAYCRVFDPRGFEFEITVPNLLWILENSNSYKGKGLEGEFVYGWSGSDLLLVPVESPDYIEILNYKKKTDLNKSFKKKELILGATYAKKDGSKWVYMGNYDKLSNSFGIEGVVEEKNMLFFLPTSYVKNPEKIKKSIENNIKYYSRMYPKSSIDGKYSSQTHCIINYSILNDLYIVKSVPAFIECVDDSCISNYADVFEELKKDIRFFYEKRYEIETCPYDYREFENSVIHVEYKDYSNTIKKCEVYRFYRIYEKNKIEFFQYVKYPDMYSSYRYSYYNNQNSVTQIMKTYSPIKLIKKEVNNVK